MRNAREFCLLGRSNTSTSQDYYRKKGAGVYRRFHHYIPVKGPGAIRRGSVHQAKALICEIGTLIKVKIRSIRRVASDGFRGILWASRRPCCRPSCICTGAGGGLHSFKDCKTSVYTTCKQIQLEPVSTVAPSPVRGMLAQAGQALSEVAKVGDIMAVETQSSETQFWLIQVTQEACCVPTNYNCPLRESGDAIFDFAARNAHAIEARRLRPITTARGANSTRVFEIDEKLPPFLVPGHLVRMGKVVVAQSQAPPPRRGRSAAAVVQVPVGKGLYEISAATKARILELCRCFD